MDVKVGDRVSIDALKVGQNRRSGVVRNMTQGLSGTRYTVLWDDGIETTFSPGAGNLIKEAGGRRRPAAKSTNSKPARAKPAAAKQASPKRAAAKQASSKAAAKRPAAKKTAKSSGAKSGAKKTQGKITQRSKAKAKR